MLTVYHSNHLENLADRLAAVVSQPAGSPLVPETIIVQSNGMARWLSLHLAQQLGICANVRFPFPASFIWEVFHKILPRVPETSSLTPPVMAWRLMGLLGAVRDDPRFAPLHGYLEDDDDFRRYELARRIADSFDQYLIYRPERILRWEAGQSDHRHRDEDWQARLWQGLRAADPGPHRVRLQQEFFAALDAESVARSGLPGRITLFGISTLPPVYLEVFQRLAHHLDVHLFLLNPCQLYWGDIVPERDIARRAGEGDGEALYLAAGNSLLASLGKQGRDFIDQVQEAQGTEEEWFADPGEDSLLHCLQSDILNLRNRGTNDCPATPVQADDRSVQVHACHGPMREVEVLHDQLLALFQAQPDLHPAEVVVMTPDIEAYAPYIEAVFATVQGERRIPFSIADRSFRQESPLVDAFFALLELAVSRFDANQVLAILETPAVQRRFGLVEDDLLLVHRWVRETRIRWGIDPQSRARLGLPATAEHTWRAGLDRLLLGYALPGNNARLFADILPYDQVEGGIAQIMGRLQAFTEAISDLQAGLDGRRSVAAWVAGLQGIVERFLAPGEDEEAQIQALREALNQLAETARQADFAEPVSLAVIKSSLRRRLETADPANRFLTGGVTFCAMVPMRSIPFQVVCLIGMNDGAYPRSHRPPGFDLMAHHFRRGDRSRRNDDRYLFLEALVSARRCLYLSFVGNSIRDNSAIPPSVLVSELLDTLRQGFCGSDGQGNILEQVLTRHPLQAFSRRYFGGDQRLFSYSQQLCEAGQEAGRGESEPQPLIGTVLPEPDEPWRSVDLERLIRFLANPARYLLRQRLGIHLEEGQGLLETREPFTLDALAGQDLRQMLLSLRLAAEPLDQALPVMRAEGRLPHGQVGTILFERQLDSVTGFAGRLEQVLPADRLEPWEVNLQLAGMHLTGRLDGIGQEGLVGYRLDKIRPRDLLNLWVRHLLLNLLNPKEIRPVSRWLGEDREVVLNPVADASELLAGLLRLYWQGLSRPLHFFPNSSYAYAQTLGRGRGDPLAAARRAWEGSEYYWGESENSYYQLVFRGSDPLDKWFAELAEAVFGPLFEHLEEI